jgi:hypothetical protein
VDNATGGELVGRSSGEWAGIVIPRMWPGQQYVQDFLLRPDAVAVELRADGSRKRKPKYLCAPGSGNRLYIPPGIFPELLGDISIPIWLTESPIKAVALGRLAYGNLTVEFTGKLHGLSIAINGVWGFRGVIGKANDANGSRVDVKGLIPDLHRIELKGRRVVIIFDVDVVTNQSVRAARAELSRELTSLGAIVTWFEFPSEGLSPEVKGIDDFLAVRGPQEALALINDAKLFDASREETNTKMLADEISLSAFFARDAGGKVYIYANGVYERGGEQYIKSQVKTLMEAWSLGHE